MPSLKGFRVLNLSDSCFQGLGLEESVCELLRSWTSKADFDRNSLPLHTEVNRVIENRKANILTHDSSYQHRRSATCPVCMQIRFFL